MRLESKQDSILFTKEIFETVSKELGVEEKAIGYIFDSYIGSLNNIVNYTDSLAVYIPRIGTLYTNRRHVNEEVKVLESDGSDIDRLNAYKQKKYKLDKMIRNYPNKIVMKYHFLHVKDGRLGLHRFSSGLKLKEIETIQNDRAAD